MIVTKKEPEERCELCGVLAELRPYGPKGEKVCFKCGMKNEKVAIKQFTLRLNER